VATESAASPVAAIPAASVSSTQKRTSFTDWLGSLEEHRLPYALDLLGIDRRTVEHVAESLT
jgi:hypothetical protein